MTTHVFIVDPTTFKYHLEYMFAGTGAKDYTIDFNNINTTSLTSRREILLSGMIADLSRVRIGDFIIFYLQKNEEDEGKFYGIFKVKSLGFLDNLIHKEKDLDLEKDYNFEFPKENNKFKITKKNILLKTSLTLKEDRNLFNELKATPNDQIKIVEFINDFYKNNQYLLKNLEKSLTFRLLIEPFEVYPEGVSEWEALDDIKDINKPSKMVWSLIYRKLRANRGNTMITHSEEERLFDLIRNKNRILEKEEIKSENLSFDLENKVIIPVDRSNLYTGKKEELNILPRLINKYKNRLAFESHLQAYILRNLELNDYLKDILVQDRKIGWIGNEVSCGVGMQRIDILLSLENRENLIMPIELKSVPASIDNKRQIQRYIDWLNQYYVPNNNGKIQPILISKKFENKREKKEKEENYDSILNSFRELNECNKDCLPLRYIEFYLDEKDNLIFEEVKY